MRGFPSILRSFNQCALGVRVPPFNSNWTGFCILLCGTEVRLLTWAAAKRSATFSRTRSHPRSLLSTAVLNSAGLGGLLRSQDGPRWSRHDYASTGVTIGRVARCARRGVADEWQVGFVGHPS